MDDKQRIIEALQSVVPNFITDRQQGIYIVTIEVGTETDDFRVEETDASIGELALRLEALAEAGFIGSYSIKGLNLPAYATPSSIYTFICRDSVSPDYWPKFSQTWEQGWRNRDAYFTDNARRSIR